MSILVTGSSRGIGLEFIRQYAARLLQDKSRSPSTRIFAACRAPSAASELQKIIQAHQELVIPITMDVADTDSVAAAVAAVHSSVTVTEFTY